MVDSGLFRLVRGTAVAAALAVCLMPLESSAQTPTHRKEIGYPLITTFRQEDHKSGTQTFGVTQDPNGVLYFANVRGVVTYDGAWWEEIAVPRDSPVFSVTSDRSGRIGVGATDEFGILEPDASGALRFRSLLPLVPSAIRANTGQYNSVCADGDGLLFVSDQFVFRWNGRTLDLLEDYRANRGSRRCLTTGGTSWIGGIDGIRLPGHAPLFAGRRVDALLPGGHVMVRQEGLFAMDGRPWAPEASAWLRGKSVMASGVLPDGRIFLATLRDGVLLLTEDGRIDQRIGAEAGLPDDLLYGAIRDRDGSLWLTYEGAIVRVDVSSPLTVLDSRNGIKGSVRDATRYDGRLYVATTHGLFTFDGQEKPPAPSMARQVEGVPGSVWSLLDHDGTLFVGGFGALSELRGNGPARSVPGLSPRTVYTMHASAADPSLIWLGTDVGMGKLRRHGQSWSFEGMLPGISQEIRSIVERDGVLWCGTGLDGVLRVETDGSTKQFGTGGMNVLEIDGRMVCLAYEGRFLQLTPDGHFLPDPALGRISAGQFDTVAADSAGNLWLNTMPTRYIRRLPAGRYAEPRPVVSTAGEVGGFRADDGGTMWLMSDRGLFRMEPLRSTGTRQQTPLIRRITGTEGTIYSGSRPTARRVDLPHAFKRLRVDFAPASYFQGLTYQYRLDPADAKWGAWTSEAFLDYTNLAAGRYTLRMRARSPEGQVSDEARWTFAVLPPWYRTPWATVLWILLAMALLAVLVWLRTRSLHAQAERLRARVMEQTVELRQTVEQLREAKESLVDKNALLEVSNVRLEQVNTRLERLSLVDELTGIANRRYFERALVDEWERALRREEPVALLMLDLDQFKLLNDSRGHPAGDDCLRRIGGFLGEAIRGSGDVVARYGGEEFAVLLPGTGSVQAAEVAERLRLGIERLAITSGARHSSVITASVGVTALVPQRGFDAHTLVERADRALYAAKRDGRNCTRVDRPSGVWLAGATA